MPLGGPALTDGMSDPALNRRRADAGAGRIRAIQHARRDRPPKQKGVERPDDVGWTILIWLRGRKARRVRSVSRVCPDAIGAPHERGSYQQFCCAIVSGGGGNRTRPEASIG
jgi:hypothetical protein